MQIGMHELLCKAQEMIARKYPTILTDKSKRGEIKNYIAQFLYDTGYTVEGYSMKQVTDRLFSEMAEYSFLTAYLNDPNIEEININGWDDVALTYLDGHIEKSDEQFFSPGHAVDIIKRLLLHSGMTIDNAVPKAEGHLPKFKLEDRLLKHFPRDIKDVEARISGLEADIETTKANTHRDEKGFSGVKIMGTDFTEKAEAGRQILEICKRISNPEPRPLGEYRGFKTEIGFDTMQKQYFIILVGKLRHMVLLGDDANGIFTRLDNKIEGMELRLRNCREELQNLHEQVENAKAELLKPFPREAELNEKQARLDILNSELNMDKKENELADEAPEPNGESGKANPPSECEVDVEIEDRNNSDRDER